ncbi:DinB family protein [Paenibacillus sp. CAA11]|uniref:DinB family protein n=1 Tax=Paenibacillus sp. CAA11 TaxID=1532905 RepID=UPI000D3828FA|nr:DinB family protein [Paenibacillus sp. CAA11]AWB45235.1 DinB family protein [Paenibacillus sp. CAA11]
MIELTKPEVGEYADYYGEYIASVPETGLIQVLEQQLEDYASVLSGLSAEQAGFRYAEGKWSIKEVVGHATDTERIMAYRLLRIARGDTTELAGFNEVEFVNHSGFEERELTDLLEEQRAVRQATLVLIQSLSEEAWYRKGIASGYGVTVRALAYIIAGHTEHHLNIIKDRYLK